jgi:hypothetical protein
VWLRDYCLKWRAAKSVFQALPSMLKGAYWAKERMEAE